MHSMSKVGLVYSDRFLEHRPSYHHPENPARLEAIVRRLKESGLWNQTIHLDFEEATEEVIALVHGKGHIESVRNACKAGGGVLDYGDTYACEKSFDVAKLAVGGVIRAIDAVCEGAIQSAFCLVRPPGHHAMPNRAMGFCIFNNVAIGAKYLIEKKGLQKVGIVDFDVHHGNGTQAIFYDNPSVLYVSIHQYPHYPGTGSKEEKGIGAGTGFTFNFPMEPNSSEDEWLRVFREGILPCVEAFKPEFLLVSAGFDAHALDPLSEQNMTKKGYHEVAKLLKSVCQKACLGPVFVLEGGYNLDALAESVEATIFALM